jgi:hypothetical protein
MTAARGVTSDRHIERFVRKNHASDIRSHELFNNCKVSCVAADEAMRP